MGYFFLLSWTPTLLTAAKLPPATAALAGAVMQVGGTVGALLLCWWLQRHRFLAIAILFVIAVPVVGAIGFAGLTSQTALLTATFFAGFLVLGIQSGHQRRRRDDHPTSLRANGSGWQLGIGRIGSIVGPLVGRVVRRPAGPEPLHVVGAAVRRRARWSASSSIGSTRHGSPRSRSCARHSNGASPLGGAIDASAVVLRRVELPPRGFDRRAVLPGPKAKTADGFEQGMS